MDATAVSGSAARQVSNMLSLKRIFDEDQIIDVPLLRAGRHLNPRKGACLTELAAALTGDVWTARPRSVHPTLSRVARQVNDLTSDPGRQELLALLPGLIGTSSPGDRAESQRVRAAVTASLSHPVEQPPTRVPGGRWWAWQCDRYVVRAVRATAYAQRPGLGRDEALRELLLASINSARQVQHKPAFMPQSFAGLPPITHLRVRTGLTREPGCDWSVLVCTPIEDDQVRVLLGPSPGDQPPPRLPHADPSPDHVTG